jgi:hypothetical protein
MTTVAGIRLLFPEFSDSSTYPNFELQMWIDLAPSFLNPCVYTDPNVLDYVTKLWVSHNVILSQTDQSASAIEAIPGQINAPTTAKTVDKVSKSMAAQLVTIGDGGMWNSTSYGIRFFQLAKMWGAGGIQLMPQGVYSLGQVPLIYGDT